MNRRQLLQLLTLASAYTAATQSPPEPIPQTTGQATPKMPSVPTPEMMFPLAPDEEKLLPAFKHFTRSKERFVPFAFADPVAKGVALVGAGFNLHAKERVHSSSGTTTQPSSHTRFTEYNDRLRLDPSAEQLWTLSGVPEDLELLRAHAVSNSVAQDYLKNKKVEIPEQARISETSAEKLFDLSARQAMHNASSYFKRWKEFTAFQKIALSDMVYQMGPNFQTFTTLITKANQEKPLSDKDWEFIRISMRGNWYNRYSDRAPDVVRMLDPHFQAPDDLKSKVPEELLPPSPPKPSNKAKPAAKSHPRVNPARGHGRAATGGPDRHDD
jgi:hypothetical protein